MGVCGYVTSRNVRDEEAGAGLPAARLRVGAGNLDGKILPVIPVVLGAHLGVEGDVAVLSAMNLADVRLSAEGDRHVPQRPLRVLSTEDEDPDPIDRAEVQLAERLVQLGGREFCPDPYDLHRPNPTRNRSLFRCTRIMHTHAQVTGLKRIVLSEDVPESLTRPVLDVVSVDEGEGVGEAAALVHGALLLSVVLGLSTGCAGACTATEHYSTI